MASKIKAQAGAPVSPDQLMQGATLYSRVVHGYDGMPARARVTSVKTWKRQPGRLSVGMKYGLRDFFTLTESELANWSLEQVMLDKQR